MPIRWSGAGWAAVFGVEIGQASKPVFWSIVPARLFDKGMLNMS